MNLMTGSDPTTIEENGNHEVCIADFTGSRVVIWDPEAGSKIYRLGYYGKPVGIRKPKSTQFSRPLELTVLEAAFLYDKHIITVRGPDGTYVSPEEFKNNCKETFNQFEDLYAVYKDLRDLNYIVRPGMKFGADFAVYQRGPGIDHAPFLVSVFPRNSKIEPIDLVRAGRLATSVKKRYVIATVLADQTIRYYIFAWFKP
jgi:tRNA-intron endonuclease